MPLPPRPLVLEQRVAFSQTDAAGIMHFSTYFFFMEAAEADLFRQLGHPLLSQSGGTSLGFPRVDCQCRFRLPVGFDELVRTELTLEGILSGRLAYRFTFSNAAGRRCATGSMTTACASRNPDGSLSASPLPGNLLNALHAWKNQPA
ncbi:MAG TPA: thioesterase family protein [Oceanipulchritudo sp.]|nr:thioesterase family protein [Oceanipulchritudo sp.]